MACGYKRLSSGHLQPAPTEVAKLGLVSTLVWQLAHNPDPKEVCPSLNLFFVVYHDPSADIHGLPSQPRDPGT